LFGNQRILSFALVVRHDIINYMEDKKLPGDYIAGFVDGEGCFALGFRRDVRHDRKGKPEYFYWDIAFAITLRSDDIKILELIKEALECGRISVTKNSSARYEVSDVNDLSGKIVPFFERYPLHAKKGLDFKLWKEALKILKRNRQIKKGPERRQATGFQKIEWNANDLERIKQICYEMKQYKSRGKAWKWLNGQIPSFKKHL